jgi:hypothetical protein
MLVFKQVLFTLVAIGSTTSGLAQTYRDWPIGVEREVDEGIYMKVVAVENGWRLWRTETRSGIDCRAVKSAVGRPHPIPIGVGGGFFRGTPFLQVYRSYNGSVTYAWNARYHGRVRVKIRRPGERFWNEMDRPFGDMTSYDGERIDVVVSSWEYPEVLVGYSEESAQFNMIGLRAITERMLACEAGG